jgi:hypothetical protein
MRRLILVGVLVAGCGGSDPPVETDAAPLDSASIDAPLWSDTGVPPDAPLVEPDASAPDAAAPDAASPDASPDAASAPDAASSPDATSTPDAAAPTADASLCIPPVTPIGITALDANGRTLNARGIHLVDWDGYLANAAPTITLKPPSDIGFPISATLTANHQRLYFDLPSNVGASGPSKTVTFNNASSRVNVRLSIFPDRDGLDEEYTLTMTLLSGVGRAETVPIIVHDEDQSSALATEILIDFGQDKTGFFTSSAARNVLQQAADDWAYFIADAPFDAVPANDEDTYIWRQDGFITGTTVKNAASYTGFLLYVYGIHSASAPFRSGGEGSWQGKDQKSGGTTLPLRRSGGVEVETAGNYNELGWRISNDPNEWWVSSNLGNEQNDLYSIVHHEMGHAHGFHDSYTRFVGTSLTSPAILAYFGRTIAIDSFDHFNGMIDPASGFGAHGNEYNSLMPRKRWMITRLDLLALEAIGYTLRPISFTEWQDTVPDCP